MQALDLRDQGWKQRDIAIALGVTDDWTQRFARITVPARPVGWWNPDPLASGTLPIGFFAPFTDRMCAVAAIRYHNTSAFGWTSSSYAGSGGFAGGAVGGGGGGGGGGSW